MSSTDDKGKQPITVSKPLDWFLTWSFTEQAKSLRFVRDEEGNIWSYPVILAGVTGSAIVPALIVAAPANQSRAVADQGALVTQADQCVYNPVTGYTEIQRTPTIWKTQISNGAGPITVWDPAAGRRYRLMGFSIVVSKEAASAGAQSITISDSGGTALHSIAISNAALVATGQVQVYTINYPANGYLSPTVDNTLVATLAGAWTAGTVAYTAWGTEE